MAKREIQIICTNVFNGWSEKTAQEEFTDIWARLVCRRICEQEGQLLSWEEQDCGNNSEE